MTVPNETSVATVMDGEAGSVATGEPSFADLARVLDARTLRLVQQQPSGCWLYLGRVNAKGHAQIRDGARRPMAHRLVFQRLSGPIPDGMVLDHLCRVPNCVNPSHLEPVTPKENTMRGDGLAAQFARRTHCNSGHEFTPDNIYWRKCGGRECLACARERGRLRAVRRAAS